MRATFALACTMFFYPLMFFFAPWGSPLLTDLDTAPSTIEAPANPA